MKRWIFLIGYSIVHISGIFPVALKSLKKKASVSFNDLGTPWAPWTLSSRSLFIGLGHLVLILYFVSGQVFWKADAEGFEWTRKNFEELMIEMLSVAIIGVTFSIILPAMMNRKEIERLLNNLCSLYFKVFKCTDPPKARRFAFIILYTMSFYVVMVVLTLLSDVDINSYSTITYLQEQYCGFIILLMEITLGVICVYLQSIVKDLNLKIKRQFPHVYEWDWKYWESSPYSRDENPPEEGLRVNVKSFLEEYRLTYRTVAEIIDQINSVYGFSLLMMVLANQISCLLVSYCYLSRLLTNLTNNLAKNGHGLGWGFGVSCIWYFINMSVICHSCEIVVKETEITTHYIATIDASKIDLESKIELLEFLNEVDGRKIRFTASNIISLNYTTLYTKLIGIITYIIVVIQYLSY